MVYKFKYCTFGEQLLENISALNSFLYYCFWICGITTLIFKLVTEYIDLKTKESDFYFGIWLCGLLLSILIYLIYIFIPKGVSIKDDKIIIAINHPTLYSIKLKHTFRISDIKNIEYIDSRENHLKNLIKQVPNRSKLEYISIYNDYILIELINGDSFVFSLDNNMEFYNIITKCMVPCAE